MKARFGITFLTVLGLGLAACDSPPTAPAMDESPAFNSSPQVQSTDQHLFHPIPANFAEAVAAAGGTVFRVHPEVNVAVASGLSDGAARAIGGTQVARDLVVQWIPSIDDLDPQTVELAADAGPAGHDPTTAVFFPFQWDMLQIDAPGAWAAGASGAGIRVAILDTGIDPFHIDLFGLVDFGSSAAFTPNLGAGPAWGDDNFHGTHVAGTVATNGIGTSGVAPHSTLIAVKVLNVFGGGTFANVIAGIVHAANVNADVINMSLGAYFPKNLPGAGTLVSALNNAVNYANSQGTLVVSAAGNNNANLDKDKNFTFVPCQSGAGICISATGPDDLRASYSNYGNSAINVAGPGGDFIDTFNPFTSMILAPCSSLSLLLPCGPGSFVFLQGTSMAAPHAAGVAALIDNKAGGAWNAGRLKTKLQQTADDLGKKGKDPDYGHGRINAKNAVQ